MKHRDQWEAWYEQHKNRSTVPSANMEQGAGLKSVAAQKATRFDRPVSIRIHSYRHRCSDSDGLCKKYVIDSLVSAGVLIDDSPTYLPEEPISIQTKIPRSQNEETIIEISEVN